MSILRVLATIGTNQREFLFVSKKAYGKNGRFFKPLKISEDFTEYDILFVPDDTSEFNAIYEWLKNTFENVTMSTVDVLKF